MRSLKEVKESFIGGLNYSGNDAAKNATYSDMSPQTREELDDYCFTTYGKKFMDCNFQEQSTARSVLNASPEEVEKQNKRDAMREAEETEEDPLADEETEDTGDEDTKDDEPQTPEETEEENKDKFVLLLDDTDFSKALDNAVTQYTSEKMLDDEYNSFAILPYVELVFEDSPYGISVEFESAVTINIDKDGKVVEREVPGINVVKYKIPEMDELEVLEDELGKTKVDLLVKDALKSIKNVPR